MKPHESTIIDRGSFQLGMINCFAEMVACGVKRLALSPPLSPKEYRAIERYSDRITAGFRIKSYLEKSLLTTDLQSEEFTKGKWVILYYEKDDVLEEYLALKKKKQELKSEGHYDDEARRKISREFGRLLSYPEHKIEEKIAETRSPFMLIEEAEEE
jgi:hypothetical protein